ncbi:uncharacterized protein LOC120326323 isoform X2 [Styela clava]
MFIVVNYGERKQALFNPNCKMQHLLENIKERCQFPRNIEIDLSDDIGNLKNLSKSTCQYANEILNVERENLVLIEVRRNGKKNDDVIDGLKRLAVPPPLFDPDVTYIPLLNDDQIVNSKFQARLTSRGSPALSETRKKDKKKTGRRNTEASNSSEKGSFDASLTSQSLSSLNSPKRNGSSKPTKKTNQSTNRSKSRGKVK